MVPKVRKPVEFGSEIRLVGQATALLAQAGFGRRHFSLLAHSSSACQYLVNYIEGCFFGLQDVQEAAFFVLPPYSPVSDVDFSTVFDYVDSRLIFPMTDNNSDGISENPYSYNQAYFQFEVVNTEQTFSCYLIGNVSRFFNSPQSFLPSLFQEKYLWLPSTPLPLRKSASVVSFDFHENMTVDLALKSLAERDFRPPNVYEFFRACQNKALMGMVSVNLNKGSRLTILTPMHGIDGKSYFPCVVYGKADLADDHAKVRCALMAVDVGSSTLPKNSMVMGIRIS